MKTRIAWFLIGFVVSWPIWSLIGWIRLRPRDYTQSWPAFVRHNAPQWLRSAEGRTLGKFRVFTPANSAIACAQIQTATLDGLPGVTIEDDDKDGTLDSILVVDSGYHCLFLADKNADGVFDSYEYMSGIDDDSVLSSDNNMDGQYDIRAGPGRMLRVAIDSQWYDLIHKDKKQYVDINGKLTEVKAVDGVWRTVEGQ